MAKKLGFNPFVILSGLDDGGDVVVIGGGSGQSTPDVYACDFDDWFTMFAVDADGSGTLDFEDYRLWFIATFGDEAEDLWEIFNDDPLYPDGP